jgi:hypothetical protein
MPDQLLTYYIENPLIIISINTESWWRVIVIRLAIDLGELVKAVKKGNGKRDGWVGKRYGDSWILWTLCLFGCISAVIVEDACVRIAWGWCCVQLVQLARQWVVNL